MNKYELKILKTYHPDYDGPEIPWGAWVGATIEFLQDGGFLTRGINIKITQKGLEALDKAR